MGMRDTKIALQILSEKVKNVKSCEEMIRTLIQEKDCMQKKIIVLERRLQNTTDHTKKMEKEWKSTICAVSQLERNAQEARLADVKKEDVSKKYGRSETKFEAVSRKDKLTRQKDCMQKKLSLLEQRIQSTTDQTRKFENKWEKANGSISKLKLNTDSCKGQNDKKEETPTTSIPSDSIIESKEIKGHTGSSNKVSFNTCHGVGINNIDSKQTEISKYSSKASDCKTISKRCKTLSEAGENTNCGESLDISNFGKQYASWISKELSFGGSMDNLSFGGSPSCRDTNDDEKLALQCLLKSIESPVNRYRERSPSTLKREGKNCSDDSSSAREKSTSFGENIFFRPRVMGKRSSMDRRSSIDGISSANISLSGLMLAGHRRRHLEREQ